MIKRALLSVSDKTGIVELARRLHGLGVELLSTGGTMKALQQAGIPVTGVSDVTGFPECLDGRVKTLHPAIHAGLLAMRSNPEHMRQIAELGIAPIDLVVINLYPFRQTIARPGVTFEEAIENIDIGGPTMLRAAAKNWQDVAVVVEPADYDAVLGELEQAGEVSRETKLRLCYKVFEHTAQYDCMIQQYLRAQLPGDNRFPDKLTVTFEKVQGMRYGENPHQGAAFYRDLGDVAGTLPAARQLHGKELSYNNINDTNGALELLREFDTTAVVAVKHGNPCGVGVADDVAEAYRLAYEADPVSVFGGIVVTNATVDAATAEQMSRIFLEIVVAPAYTDAALEILTRKKNLRVLQLDTTHRVYPAGERVLRKVAGGLLVQDIDDVLLPEGELKVVTDRAPTEKQMQDLLLAWKIVKHTKSNGIAIARDNQSLGIGPGQVNRIWSTQMAIERSGEKVRGAALASDAFFPFDDCVKAAAQAGIACIIQPGGSVRDEDSIRACNEAGIAMVFTGMRHFKH
ncbi:MAG TPA: bifunctional phosphoribosylaminoimidazolecarboxamide formyltransferase/IMP cyclohydrolase [Candidatus Onthenecus intestinigallinarum]|uniref:Bifunctional purine biosynthesis protein PurH n=1 Tax=Candidatus Onthenecus intestinigallinarum TaxID=2840875 RepID=A0A9D0ZAQ5_9FIRM|nr:bifunctional phosphoribosylaminoimidazolecarboxamide formyltransferase/IMP cyclohydrolase [Candidatus Onthenecus intestinigallinarum]